MADKHPFRFQDLMAVERISDPAVHPDGKLVAFVSERHDPRENSVRRTIKLWDIGENTTRDLTPGDHNDTNPRWSPDGSRLLFVSDRAEEEQLWLLPFRPGGEARRLTGGYGGIAQPVWAPDGGRVAFSRRVTIPRRAADASRLNSAEGTAQSGGASASSSSPDGSSQEVDGSSAEARQQRRAAAYGLPNTKSSARIADELLFRHWNTWRHRDRRHVFVMDVESGESGDISPGEVDVPPISLGGAQDFVFSPDGSEIAFIMNPDSVPAVSTNNSLFVQKLDGITTVGAARRVSHNDAMELEPRYSPDGRYLAFLGAERPGYEADRLRVKLVDRAAGAESVRVLTEDFDRSVSSYVWRSAEELLFLAEDRGYMSLYGVGTNKDNGAVVQYTAGLFQSNLRLIDENRVFVTREATHYPAEPTVLRLQAPAAPDTETGPGRPVPRDQELLQRLTLNASLFEELRVRPVETFWYRGADDDWVHAFMLKPPDFDPEARYPLMLLIHGGPQGAFADNFHFRWNAQLFAAEGYIVLMTNPRGSTGYGAGFTDQISGDWTGRCYTDIMNGVDAALERFSFIDPERMAAAGASFGGFMINWIAGHSTRFRALVSHDGIFNQETMSYTTDELWFDMWEHGGMPYENPEEFRRTSPHAAVEAFRTPTLVIQGEQDYRCPPSEGIGMFTALQVRGVPSRLLYFPDEGHFVTKPANAEVWYKTVLEFLAEWI